MLNWTSLSSGNKICGALLAILCAAVGVIGVVVVESVPHATMLIGLELFLAGVLLIPAAFESRKFSSVRLSEVPTISKMMIGAGLLMGYLGFFLRSYA